MTAQSDISREGEMTRWQPIESAPKDGTPFWAYLYQSGIRLMRWAEPEEFAELEGGSPDDYDGAFVELDDLLEEWSPRWWLPIDALPPPPSKETQP